LTRLLCGIRAWFRWWFGARFRRLTLERLRTAFGDRLDSPRMHAIGRSAFINRCLDRRDGRRAASLDPEGVSALVGSGQEGLRHIGTPIRDGRGILLITPGVGNTILLPAYLSCRGAPVHALMIGPDPGELPPVWRVHGVTGIPTGELDGVEDALEAGEMVVYGMLPGPGPDPVWVPFLGGPVPLTSHPCALARRTGAVMLPSALVRQQDHRYRLLIEPPIRTVSTGDAVYDDWENTRRLAAALEAIIERYPAQWPWSEPHTLWKAPPEDWTPPSPPARESLYRIRVPGRSSGGVN
jgi:lauroyl/myristoyl acyltransferase